jgi:hypothetical protein
VLAKLIFVNQKNHGKSQKLQLQVLNFNHPELWAWAAAYGFQNVKPEPWATVSLADGL